MLDLGINDKKNVILYFRVSALCTITTDCVGVRGIWDSGMLLFFCNVFHRLGAILRLKGPFCLLSSIGTIIYHVYRWVLAAENPWRGWAKGLDIVRYTCSRGWAF